MSAGSRRSLARMIAAIVVAVVPLSALDADDASLTPTERALLSVYRAALAGPALAETMRQSVARQVGENPPLAFVDGYWVTPVNMGALLRDAAIRAALLESTGNASEAARAEELLRREARLPRLVGLAFTAHPLGASLGVPHARDLVPASPGAPSEIALFLVMLKDVDEVVIEYLPPPPVGTAARDDECRYFCGEPAAWDFDHDGIPNREDDDDDGDGVEDARDAYPYWPGAASCDCGERHFTSFTEKFSAGVTRTVLRAREWLDDPARIVAVRGAQAGSGLTVDLRVVFP